MIAYLVDGFTVQSTWKSRARKAEEQPRKAKPRQDYAPVHSGVGPMCFVSALASTSEANITWEADDVKDGWGFGVRGFRGFGFGGSCRSMCFEEALPAMSQVTA